MTEKGKTSGAGPLTWSPPVLDIEGKEYKLRRLGLLDVQRAAKIVATVVQAGGRNALANMGNVSTMEVGTYILDLLPLAMDEVIDWMADYLGIARGIVFDKIDEATDNTGTIRDPDVFPLGSEIKVIEALLEHEDVQAFFGSVKRMMKHPALQSLTARKVSRGPSTASKRGIAGPTKKS